MRLLCVLVYLINIYTSKLIHLPLYNNNKLAAVPFAWKLVLTCSCFFRFALSFLVFLYPHNTNAVFHSTLQNPGNRPSRPSFIHFVPSPPPSHRHLSLASSSSSLLCSRSRLTGFLLIFTLCHLCVSRLPLAHLLHGSWSTRSNFLSTNSGLKLKTKSNTKNENLA